MEKYYQPFFISSIQRFEDKTLVKVYFYKINRTKFNDNLIVRDRGGLKPERINASSGGILESIEIFELPKMTSEEARAEVYSRIEKSKRSKRFTINA